MNIKNLGLEELTSNEMVETEGGSIAVGIAISVAIFAVGTYVGYRVAEYLDSRD